MRKILKHALITAVVLFVLGAAGAFLVVHSGLYDIAASRPHSSFVRYMLTRLQENSVAARAEHVRAPALEDPALVREGLVLYREYCVVCHGAPGESREVIGIGMNPSPPPLVTAARDWSDAEIYWIITNGLKMAGMPAFDFGTDPRQAWALTAFVRRMRTLSPLEYHHMVASVESVADTTGIRWLAGDQGWELLRASGRADRGRTLIDGYGCGSCHEVPGVRGAVGRVGPPLTSWGRRHYIAGLIANTPDNLVTWIVDPQQIEPHTAMPNLGVTPEQALDIAAYLLSLR